MPFGQRHPADATDRALWMNQEWTAAHYDGRLVVRPSILELVESSLAGLTDAQGEISETVLDRMDELERLAKRQQATIEKLKKDVRCLQSSLKQFAAILPSPASKRGRWSGKRTSRAESGSTPS